MNKKELKAFLDEKVVLFENPEFITLDPIQIPHRFSQKEDIEIAAFLSATIAWGNRKSIINNAKSLMLLMDDSPFDFVINHTPKNLKVFDNFVHRTFNSVDIQYFIQALQHIYKNKGGLEIAFQTKNKSASLQQSIHDFKKIFFELPHLKRTQKHVSDPLKGSAAKRINMFLRWMVRPSKNGVDFGLWTTLNTSQLSCPLDIHSGKIARSLGLLQRKQNDAKALHELDLNLRKFDPVDPVKYDFALFGLGVHEGFGKD